ncbi:MAG TPA: hypothetical protein VHM90_08065 [Phycisphaerae bacterium]|nr:hypothetical protein [Phycisphaerae bacterium]
MADALTNLREIGSVAELRAAAAKARPQVLDNNAHLHLPPNFSAFSNVEQAMALADEQNVRIVGASNYYDYAVYNDFAARARQHNILPLFGIEIICMIEELRAAGVKINDPGNPGKMYICGKGIVKFGNMPEEARQILGIIRKNDSERTSKMVDKIALLLAERGLLNMIDANTVANLVVRRHAVLRETVFLQERHVAQSLQEFIFSAVTPDQRISRITTFLGAPPKMKSPDDSIGLQNELRSHLMKAGKPGFVAETFIDFAPAMRLILALGGFPSYPILADGSNPICPFEDPVEKLVANLKQRRIFAAELITGRNAQSTVIKYAKAVRGAGMIITYGTEHNTLDLIPMKPVCMKNEPVPEDLQEIFYEGACVIAAHQFLAAHGEVGYVDSAGNLNPAYSDTETRIRELAKLGDTVIRRYLKKS